jgi:hypothetical protein
VEIQNDRYILPEGFFDRPLTAREVEDFALCPRRFLLSQFVSREETRRFLGGPAVMHNALRGSIVRLYREGNPQENAEAKLLESFDDLWEGELCADSVEEERLAAQGRRILSEFAAEFVAERPAALAADMSLTGELRGVSMVAVADLVFAPAGEGQPVLVVRLNSRGRPPGRGELSKELSAGVLLLLAGQHFAPEEVKVGYYCLRPGKLVEVSMSDDEMAHLQHVVSSRVKRMRRETEFAPRKGKHCRWCRVRSRCEIWRR